MIDYPYDEARDFIDRETFNVLDKHFSLVRDYQERRGAYIFKFDLGPYIIALTLLLMDHPENCSPL